jgi:hypothetical protein
LNFELGIQVMKVAGAVAMEVAGAVATKEAGEAATKEAGEAAMKVAGEGAMKEAGEAAMKVAGEGAMKEAGVAVLRVEGVTVAVEGVEWVVVDEGTSAVLAFPSKCMPHLYQGKRQVIWAFYVWSHVTEVCYFFPWARGLVVSIMHLQSFILYVILQRFKFYHVRHPSMFLLPEVFPVIVECWACCPMFMPAVLTDGHSFPVKLLIAFEQFIFFKDASIIP